MKRAWLRQHGKGSLELIEEASHLLRRAPVAALACYYAGALPFVLGLLYFWADMSRSAFARPRLAGSALAVALLFIWMKTGQTIFARRLRAELSGEAVPQWTLRRCLRIAAQQTILQPSGLFLLPVALITILPFGLALAFFQNVTVLSDGESSAVKPLVKRALAQTTLWPQQNLAMIAALAAFGLCVFLNWVSAAFVLPQLLKMFLGIESVITQSPLSLLNSTFLASMLALTYLSVDPLLKTIYVLRCFYGESLKSGDDLRSELRQSAVTARVAVALLVCCFGFACASPGATPPPESSTPTAGSPRVEERTPTSVSKTASAPAMDLDRAIDDVIQQRKYAWRMPREKAVEEPAEQGIFARFFDRVLTTLKEWATKLVDWLGDLLDRLLRRRGIERSGSRLGWITPSQALIALLIVVLACVLAVWIVRLVQQRRRKSAVVAAEAIQPALDLADESVGADQLPEDGWMQLARALIERGEFRLALRAIYLSGLAHLAARNLITLAKCKSNREYERELRRRGHAFPDLLPVFGDTVSVFDRVWYGLHAVDGELLEHFAGNVERIKAAG